MASGIPGFTLGSTGHPRAYLPSGEFAEMNVLAIYACGPIVSGVIQSSQSAASMLTVVRSFLM